MAAAEAALATHAAQNASSISRNAALTGQESASAEAHFAAQKEAARLKRLAAKEEEEEERREIEEVRRDTLEKLATSTEDPDAIMKEGQKIILKKSTARRTAAEKAKQARSDEIFGAASDNGSATSGFMIKGLKPIIAAEPEKPYDPFGGMSMHREYYTLQDHYEHRWLDQARTDAHITAGGYDLKEYYARTMFEAFAGLGCFIEDEIAARDSAVATASAAVVGGN